MIDFTTAGYLKSGNEIQKRVYEILTRYRIFEKLEEYSPLLAGTIPIEIDTERSDLDIICQFENQNDFTAILYRYFRDNDHFTLEEITVTGEKSVVSNFMLEGFPIEIFGQNKPVTEQNAYRHMVAEYKLLQEKGEDFKQKIIELKKKGIKTEPAFGILLGLENPYEDLLKL